MKPHHRLRRKIAQALADVPQSDGTARGCLHLPGADPVTGRVLHGVVCVQHTDRVRCFDCSARHIRSLHDWDEEHTCDACRSRDDAPYGWAAPSWLKVRGLLSGAVLTPVHVAGLGLCQPCMAVTLQGGAS